MLTTGCPPFLRSCCCWRGTCRVGLRWRGGGRRGWSTGVARIRPCGAAQRSCAGAERLPRAGAQLWTASFCWGGVTGGVRGCDACRAASMTFNARTRRARMALTRSLHVARSRSVACSSTVMSQGRTWSAPAARQRTLQHISLSRVTTAWDGLSAEGRVSVGQGTRRNMSPLRQATVVTCSRAIYPTVAARMRGLLGGLLGL